MAMGVRWRLVLRFSAVTTISGIWGSAGAVRIGATPGDVGEAETEDGAWMAAGSAPVGGGADAEVGCASAPELAPTGAYKRIVETPQTRFALRPDTIGRLW